MTAASLTRNTSMPQLDQLTLATIPIVPFFQNTALPPATSFVYRRQNRDYLITNWHVVTGKNTETGENLRLGAASASRASCSVANLPMVGPPISTATEAAAALPSSVMNARRLMSDMGLPTMRYQPANRRAFGLAHVQPAAGRPASPWGKPELF